MKRHGVGGQDGLWGGKGTDLVGESVYRPRGGSWHIVVG